MAAPSSSAVKTSTGVPSKPPSAGFPPFDTAFFPSQLFWLAITFGFLYVALKRSLLPRIADVIEARQDGIARDLRHADALKSETEQALAAYEKSLADAKAKAGDIAKSTRASISAEVDTQRTRTEADLAKQLVAAEMRIAESKTRALASVTEIAAETVSVIVTKLSGVPVDKAEAARAVAGVRRS